MLEDELPPVMLRWNEHRTQWYKKRQDGTGSLNVFKIEFKAPSKD